jgi:hypothetical protein
MIALLNWMSDKDGHSLGCGQGKFFTLIMSS